MHQIVITGTSGSTNVDLSYRSMHLDNFLQKRVTTQAEQRWETAAFHGEFVKGIHPHNSIKSEFTKKKGKKKRKN